MIITATALAGIVLAGCGGDRGGTTTTVDTGVVTIETDTVVTNTIKTDVASSSGAQTLKASILATAATTKSALDVFMSTLPQG